MITSLCIANERLLAVCGHADGRGVTIRKYASAPLAPGTVINGLITDEAAFVTALNALFSSLGGRPSGVRLALNSSQIYVKRGVVPKLPKRRLLKWVASEFSDVDPEDDELICDCMLVRELGSEQGCAALLCAARKSLIASYVELMRAQKLKIDCIDTTHAALQKLVALMPSTRQETCIVLCLDGNVLDAALYVDGEYRLNNRVRLIAERGGAESTAEISRMVSSIIQFNLSERSGKAVRRVFVVGGREDERAMMQAVSTAYDLQVAPLSDPDGAIRAGEGFALAEYALAAGNLIGM